MSLLLSYWVLMQELYPALTVALLAALKVAAIYLLASIFSWWGRGRSALFRSWLWRATFCGWLVTLVWVVAPSSLGKLGGLTTLTGQENELPEEVQDYLAHSPQVGWKPFELAPQASRKEFLALAPDGALPPWVHPADHDNSRWQMQKSWLRLLERWWIPVWLTGAVLLGGWRVGRAFLGLAWLHRNGVAGGAPLVDLVAREVRSLQMAHVPECRVVPGLSSPMLTGLTGATIWLPLSVASWPGETTRFAVQHELAHLHRRDGLWQWIGLVTSVVWWWHPLAWKGFKALKLEAEYAADELVARQADREPDYAQALLEIARAVISPKHQAAGVAMVSGPAVGGRIKTVLTKSPGKGRLNLQDRGCFLFFLMLVVVIAGFSVQSAYARYRHFQPLERNEAVLARETLDNLLAKHKRLRRIKLEAQQGMSISYPKGRVVRSDVKIDLDTWTEARTERAKFLVQSSQANGQPATAEWEDQSHSHTGEGDIDLGFQYEYELMRLLKVLLEAGKPKQQRVNVYAIEFQEGDRMGNRTFELVVTRGRRDPLSVSAYIQYIVDIERGLLREVRTVGAHRLSNQPNIVWALTEPLQSPEGIWYPRRYSTGGEQFPREVQINRFEVLGSP